jgi:hypothetical protein
LATERLGAVDFMSVCAGPPHSGLMRGMLQRKMSRQLLRRLSFGCDFVLHRRVDPVDFGETVLLRFQRIEITAAEVGSLADRLEVLPDAVLVVDDLPGLGLKLRAPRSRPVDVVDDGTETGHRVLEATLSFWSPRIRASISSAESVVRITVSLSARSKTRVALVTWLGVSATLVSLAGFQPSARASSITIWRSSFDCAVIS